MLKGLLFLGLSHSHLCLDPSLEGFVELLELRRGPELVRDVTGDPDHVGHLPPVVQDRHRDVLPAVGGILTGSFEEAGLYRGDLPGAEHPCEELRLFGQEPRGLPGVLEAHADCSRDQGLGLAVGPQNDPLGIQVEDRSGETVEDGPQYHLPLPKGGNDPVDLLDHLPEVPLGVDDLAPVLEIPRQDLPADRLRLPDDLPQRLGEQPKQV